MDGGLFVMVVFALGILVALAVSLLTIVLRQVREGDITWLTPRTARVTSREAQDEARVTGDRGRSR